MLGEFDWVEVEQMGFDGEGVGAKGGAVADVSNGLEEFGVQAATNGQGSDVDAIGGQEFGVGREVDGGDGVAGTVSAAGGGRAVDGEGAAEERTGVADVAPGEQLADAAGGDGEAANAARGVDGDGEAEFAAEGFEAVDACLGVVAEAEVFALVDLGGVDGVDQDFRREVSRVHVTECVGEGEDEGGVDASGGEEFELTVERGDEGEGRFGAEDPGGVGVEGDSEGLSAEEAGAFDDFGDHSLMAEVHSVEVANGGDYGGVRGGEVGELAVDVQCCQLSVVSCQLLVASC